MDRRGAGHFKSRAQDASWANYNSGERFDWNDFQSAASSNSKPSMTTLTLRLPDELVEGIKVEANKRDIPYRMLMKIWLEEALAQSRSL